MNSFMLKYNVNTPAKTMQERFVRVSMEVLNTNIDLRDRFVLVDEGLLYGVKDVLRLYREPVTNIYVTKVSGVWYQFNKEELANYYKLTE